MDERSGETRVERSSEAREGTKYPKRYYGFLTREPWGFTEAEWSDCLVTWKDLIDESRRLGQIEDRGVEGLY